MTIDNEKNIKPQEVITIFRTITNESDNSQWKGYPELEDFFNKGFYIEDFKQTLLSPDRYMITFTFRRFNAATY